jgi:hypothetical protein
VSDTLYLALGKVALQWGNCEFGVDMIVGEVYHWFDGRKYGGVKPVKRIPKHLDSKLQFLRLCAQNNPDLAFAAQPLLVLVGEYERHSNRRHELIHGTPVDLEPINGAFVFHKLEFDDPQIHRIRKVYFEVSTIDAWLKELLALGSATHEMAMHILRRAEDLGRAVEIAPKPQKPLTP